MTKAGIVFESIRCRRRSNSQCRSEPAYVAEWSQENAQEGARWAPLETQPFQGCTVAGHNDTAGPMRLRPPRETPSGVVETVWAVPAT